MTKGEFGLFIIVFVFNGQVPLSVNMMYNVQSTLWLESINACVENSPHSFCLGNALIYYDIPKMAAGPVAADLVTLSYRAARRT